MLAILSQALEGCAVLQGRTVSFGFLKNGGDWYRAVMSTAVCAFFVWVNFVARSHAQRNGRARELRKKRLQVQAKHSRGPVYVNAAEHQPVTDNQGCIVQSGGEQACGDLLHPPDPWSAPDLNSPRGDDDVLPALHNRLNEIEEETR